MRENQYTTICNDPADALKLPEAPELERAVLGALLLESQYVADVRGILTSTAFCNTQNAAIYDAICKLDDRGSTPDLFTVGQEAKKAGIPLSEVATLTQDVGSGVEILNHARILADLDMRRRLILWAEELKAKAQTDPDAVNWAMSGIERITGDVARIASARSIGDVMQDTLTDLERRQQAHQRGECVGISTGLPCMDRITGGWRGGQLVILAARPAMGKTAVALHFAQAAAGAGVPVCIFSLEMPATQLGGRMLVGASGVDARAFRSGAVSTEDWQRIEPGAARLSELPVTIIDTPSISMPAIRAQCRALQRQGRCGMVVIDYLQLTAPDSDKRNNREREVAEMSRAAKVLAKELDVPVILLSQLSRKVEERADKTPVLADLRESGAIEQDADMVIFIDRPAIRKEETIDTAKFGLIPSEGVGVFSIAKNREGATGRIYFRHNESLTRITDYDTTPSTPTDEQNGPF